MNKPVPAKDSDSPCGNTTHFAPYYLIIILLFLYGADLRLSGDTVALIDGLEEVWQCILAGDLRCNPSVSHFPIFQYLVALPFKLGGASNAALVEVLARINLLFFLLSVWIFAKVATLGAGRRGAAHLGVLIAVSGYLTWYAVASFNEATAFGLFAALAYGAIAGWPVAMVAVLAFLCTLTKEVSFPFVLYFLFLAFLAQQATSEVSLKGVLSLIREFVIEYWLVLLSVFVGVLVNGLFNIFRYGSFSNPILLDPLFKTPIEFIPELYRALLFSPAGGLIYTWFSLCAVTVAVLFLHRRTAGYQALALLGAIIGVLLYNLGLAMWYSPFGWYAWGPRLTLPVLGAVGVIAVYVMGHSLAPANMAGRGIINKNLIFLVIFLSAMPNMAVLVDEGKFFARMFAPTNVAEESGIVPFTIQSVAPDTYMQAVVESHAREIIVPVTLDVVFNNSVLFFLLAFALYGIVAKSFSELSGGSRFGLDSAIGVKETSTGGVSTRISPSRSVGFGVAVLLCVTVSWIMMRLVSVTPFTGDEPRYLYYAAGIAQNFDLHLDLDAWKEFLGQRDSIGAYEGHLDTDGAGVLLLPGEPPAHALLVSALTALTLPFLAQWPVERFLSVSASIASLLVLIAWFRSQGVPLLITSLGIASVALTLPMLAYSAMFYPEIWIVLLVSVGFLLLTRYSNPKSLVVLGVIVSLLPFVHLRAAASALTLGIAVVFLILNDKDSGRRKELFVVFLATVTCGGLLFVSFNSLVYGNIFGSVSTARPSYSLDSLIALFSGLRHGLLTFSPIMAFSIVGLVRGAWVRDRRAYLGLLGLVLTVIVSIGPDPGECPPARFMVQAAPYLIIGMVLIIDDLRKYDWVVKLAFVLALSWTALNAAYYWYSPARYLENRTENVTAKDLLAIMGIGPIRSAHYSPVAEERGLLDKINSVADIPLSNGFIVIDVRFRSSRSIASITATLGGGLGYWTTLPDRRFWNLAVLSASEPGEALNSGPRSANLALTNIEGVRLILPDNGQAGDCPELIVDFHDLSGGVIRARASCED